MKNKKSLLLKILFILTLGLFVNISYVGDLIKPGLKKTNIFQPNYDHNIAIKDHYKIAIDVRSIPYFQNKQIASRIKIAAESLGWDVHIIDIVDFFGSVERAEKLKKLAPDFMIVLGYNEEFPNEDKNFSYMNFENTNFDKYIFFSNPPLRKVSLLDKYFINPLYIDFLCKFDGFLYNFDDSSIIAQYVKSNGGDFYGIEFQPYVGEIKTNIVVDKFSNPKLYYSTNNYNYDIDFYHSYNLTKILDKKSSIDFYGIYEKLPAVENNWKGIEPYDGNELSNLMSEYAGVIILSDQITPYFYIKPTLEAIASGSLIITTHNEFADKYFADTALFIDDTSAKKMAAQILQHQQWIKDYPEKARSMALKAQEIFSSDFKTMDKQLRSLARMHEYKNSKIHQELLNKSTMNNEFSLQ